MSKPKVALSGRDGNAFVVLGACLRAAKKAGWTAEQVAAWRAEAEAGDYDHLLQTAMKHFEVE